MAKKALAMCGSNHLEWSVWDFDFFFLREPHKTCPIILGVASVL